MRYTKITWSIIFGFFIGFLAAQLGSQEPHQLGSTLWTASVHCEIHESKATNCKLNPGFTLDNVVTEWYTLYIGNTSNEDDSADSE
jgi:hypothetical protein